MEYLILPVVDVPRHVFMVDVELDGAPMRAKVEIRYLEAPDQWVISIADHETGEELVRQVPLVCSYGEINDLLGAFGHLRNGVGIGSLFVLKNTDKPDTEDPGKDTLKQFQILWGDKYDEGKL